MGDIIIIADILGEKSIPKYHGIRFDPIHGDSVNIPFQKEKVRNNWDFFGDWMQLLIHDLACTE